MSLIMRHSLCVMSSLLQARALATKVAEQSEDLFFKKLLTGREIANPALATSRQEQQLFSMAQNMQNQQYLVGDPATREAIIVDGNYDPQGIEKIADDAGYTIVAYVATHFHYDHIGDKSKGIDGMRHWVEDRKVPAWIHTIELDQAAAQIGVDVATLTPYAEGDVVAVGAVSMRVIHTPGHSPGSSVLVVKGASGAERNAITGDTIFAGSCGRLDLPGSSKSDMFDSLLKLRAELGDETMDLWPGHAYGAEQTTVADEKRGGFLQPELTRERWHAMMGS